MAKSKADQQKAIKLARKEQDKKQAGKNEATVRAAAKKSGSRWS